MNALEKLLNVFAPHNCLVCSAEGKLICAWCVPDAFTPVSSRCYSCQKLTKNFRVCDSCRHKSVLSSVWVFTEYQMAAQQLLVALKFERTVGGAQIIAEQLDQFLPYFKPHVLVAYCPTATSRTRVRGYDQSKLIARELAQKRGLLHIKLLSRVGQQRQVGARGGKRREQLQNAFLPVNNILIQGAEILLIDDVLTTGATLEAAAKTLKAAGAKRVHAAVFAQSF